MIRDGFLIADLLGTNLRKENLSGRFGCPTEEKWIGVDY